MSKQRPADKAYYKIQEIINDTGEKDGLNEAVDLCVSLISMCTNMLVNNVGRNAVLNGLTVKAGIDDALAEVERAVEIGTRDSVSTLVSEDEDSETVCTIKCNALDTGVSS